MSCKSEVVREWGNSSGWVEYLPQKEGQEVALSAPVYRDVSVQIDETLLKMGSNKDLKRRWRARPASYLTYLTLRYRIMRLYELEEEHAAIKKTLTAEQYHAYVCGNWVH